MISCSLNEIETLLSKAARGNGADAALAHKFARAAVHCLCHNANPKLIHNALSDLPGGIIVEYAVKIHGILSQATASQITIPEGDALWNGYIETLPFENALLFEGGYLIDPELPNRAKPPARLQICESDLTQWQKMAARTFVPESTQSRLSGAGAGLTDND